MEKIERNIDIDRRIIADYYRTESQYEKALEIQTKAFTAWSTADTRDYTHPEENNKRRLLYIPPPVQVHNVYCPL